MLATISVLSTYNLQCIVSTLYSIENKDNQALEFEPLLSENRSIENVLLSTDLTKRKIPPKSADDELDAEFINKLDVVNLLSISVFKSVFVLSALLFKSLA